MRTADFLAGVARDDRSDGDEEVAALLAASAERADVGGWKEKLCIKKNKVLREEI